MSQACLDQWPGVAALAKSFSVGLRSVSWLTGTKHTPTLEPGERRNQYRPRAADRGLGLAVRPRTRAPVGICAGFINDLAQHPSAGWCSPCGGLDHIAEPAISALAGAFQCMCDKPTTANVECEIDAHFNHGLSFMDRNAWMFIR